MPRGETSHGMALVRWIGLAMALPALVAVVLLGRNAALVIESINESALAREKAALERGIRLLGEIHASELLSHALRDEAFRNVVLSKNADWIQQNLGNHALSPDGPQDLIVVDAKGKAIFASQIAAAPSAKEAERLLAPAGRAMARARDLYRKAHASGEGFGDTVIDGVNDGVYVTDMAHVDGYPAMVTVTPFAPESAGRDPPQDPTLLVGVQRLSEGTLDKVEALAQIEDINHVSADHTEQTGEYAHAIHDADGRAITHLTWEFKQPGDAVLRAAAPAIGLSLAIVLLLTVAGAAAMRRLTRQLADSEAAAIHAARHDAATGLANRGWFMSVFARLLAPIRTDTTVRGVMLIDCDYFKAVNDTLGHAAGDAVLRAIALRLADDELSLEIAARLGGDEFAAITKPVACESDVAGLAEQVRTCLMAPVPFGSHLIPASVSIGAAAVVTPSDEAIDAVLVRADLALYRAKRDGRGCARIFDAEIDSGAAAMEEAATALNRLRRACSAEAA